MDVLKRERVRNGKKWGGVGGGGGWEADCHVEAVKVVGSDSLSSFEALTL